MQCLSLWKRSAIRKIREDGRLFVWIGCLFLGGGGYFVYSVLLYGAIYMADRWRKSRLPYALTGKMLLIFAVQAGVLIAVNRAALMIEGPTSFIAVYFRVSLTLYAAQLAAILLVPKLFRGKRAVRTRRALESTWLDAFSLGIFLYISGHLPAEEASASSEIVSQSFLAAFAAIRFALRNKNLSQRCQIYEKTEEVQRLNRRLTVAHDRVLTALASSLEKRDAYTAGHSDRVAHYASTIAEELNFSKEQRSLIHLGGLLHDLGKIGIPDSILHKEGGLTESEYLMMKKHPEIGEELLRRVYDYFPALGHEEMQIIFDIVLYHHERPDGKGYPRGFVEAEIPVYAKILAVADAFDAMTSNRSYRPAMSEERALEILAKESGTQFWAPAVNAFIRLRKGERRNTRIS